MPRRSSVVAHGQRACQWLNLEEALHHFGTCTGATQSQQHIRPLHWDVACRLVLEGGFHPDDVTPRPPFSVQTRGNRKLLQYDPSKATNSERTILGGLKTKNVDVVVTKDGIGPVMAVSCKGMTGAFRNLTNRLEETIGECTNLHITYPAMVFGYMFVIRTNRKIEAAAAEAAPDSAVPARQLAANDVALLEGGAPVETIFRFHAALRELTGRRGIRNDVSRYEAVTLAMVEPTGPSAGTIFQGFPPEGSSLRIERFFQTLYLRYEERYLLGAPDLKSVTKRLEWNPESPVFKQTGPADDPFPWLDYDPRTESP